MDVRYVGFANDLPGRVFMPPDTLLDAGESVSAFLDAGVDCLAHIEPLSTYVAGDRRAPWQLVRFDQDLGMRN